MRYSVVNYDPLDLQPFNKALTGPIKPAVPSQVA